MKRKIFNTRLVQVNELLIKWFDLDVMEIIESKLSITSSSKFSLLLNLIEGDIKLDKYDNEFDGYGHYITQSIIENNLQFSIPVKMCNVDTGLELMFDNGRLYLKVSYNISFLSSPDKYSDCEMILWKSKLNYSRVSFSTGEKSLLLFENEYLKPYIRDVFGEMIKEDLIEDENLLRKILSLY